MDWHLLSQIAALLSVRYFGLAGVAFVLFYTVFKAKSSFRKIQPKSPTAQDYRREIAFSISTLVIFSTVPTLLLSHPAVRPHTTFYLDIDQYGALYFWAAFPLMAVMHDTYFYWMHRLMHHPKLFRTFHLLHHRSSNPSPWAAYSFHPAEAFVEVGIFAIFLFTIPVHALHLGLFFLFMILYNVYGHLGYELYPQGFHRGPIGKWINTSVSHNMHHQHFRQNYGLYFTFWDRIMGTVHKNYEQRFDEVTAPACHSDETNVYTAAKPHGT